MIAAPSARERGRIQVGQEPQGVPAGGSQCSGVKRRGGNAGTGVTTCPVLQTRQQLHWAKTLFLYFGKIVGRWGVAASPRGSRQDWGRLSLQRDPGVIQGLIQQLPGVPVRIGAG